MSKATYIFGEREYVLTGREAKKSSTREGGKDRAMVEIRPVSVTDETDRSNNKWVKIDDLYHVLDNSGDS